MYQIPNITVTITTVEVLIVFYKGVFTRAYTLRYPGIKPGYVGHIKLG